MEGVLCMIKKIAVIFFVVFAFLLGLFVEKNFDTSDINPLSYLTSENVRLGGYEYISPLLECEQVEGLGGVNFNKLESEIDEYIESKKSKGEISSAAVYFRQLRNGAWFGVNERKEYAPASLLKVPVMMAYFKAAEYDKSILEKEIAFNGSIEAINQRFAPSENLQVGEAYTVEDLLERLIKYSDNNALVLLAKGMNSGAIDKLMSDIGIENSSSNNSEDNMSVRSYSSLFRILYNASYLNKDYSEKALQLLANTSFDEGLRKGVPKDVEIAHKFGQRDVDGVGLKQLHDCGIVYHPDGPYLLCVMTRGFDYDILSNVIGEISKRTYNSYSKSH